MEQAKAAAQSAFMNYYCGYWKGWTKKKTTKKKKANKEGGKQSKSERFKGKENLPPPSSAYENEETRETDLDDEVQEAIEGIIQYMRDHNTPNSRRPPLRKIL